MLVQDVLGILDDYYKVIIDDYYKAIIIKDGDNEKELARYDGKNSIPEELNEAEVKHTVIDNINKLCQIWVLDE